MKRPNRKRRTPIPGLAEHIAGFTGSKAKKRAAAPILARLADRLIAISIPTTQYRERRITQ